MLYRIFTEDVNREKIEAILTKYYPGFTITKAKGYWRLQKEDSLIIEIVTEDTDTTIKQIAGEIKTENNQQAVLIQKIKNQQFWV